METIHSTRVQGLPNPMPFYLKALRPKKTAPEGLKIPELSINWTDFKFEKDSVAKYSDICHIASEPGEIPLLFPHSYLGPLHLKILTHSQFPLNIVGSVHSRNHIIQHQLLNDTDSYQLRLSIGGHRWRPQGFEVDLYTEIHFDGKLVWESITTFLLRRKHNQEDSPSPLAEILSKPGSRILESEFLVPLTVGKKFGFLTKDINPIHMSSSLAKIFGFEKDICHGMWALGRAMANCQRPVGDKLRCDAIFKGPIFIGDKVRLFRDKHSADQFELYSGKNQKPSLIACYRQAQEGETLTSVSNNCH